MEETKIKVERHEQQIKTLEREMKNIKEEQAESRIMSQTLATLVTEMKHTNENLARVEKKIDEMEHIPRQRLQQIITAIIAALSGGLVSAFIGMIIK